jgi:hypothetical protein
MENKPEIYFDVKFDGEDVLLYDRYGKQCKSIPSKIYKGLPEIIKRSKSSHTREITESEHIAVNPIDLTRLTSTSMYSWFAKYSIMKERGYSINTNWDVKYVTSPTEPEEDKSILYIVPSTKSPYFKNGMMPLLETIIHVHQYFWGLTLKQIATYINKEFKPSFLDEFNLMKYVFENFRKELAELCVTESTPITKLYQSDFNVTFDHDYEKEIPISTIRSIKHLKETVVGCLSSIFDKRTYGNIPWTITSPSRKDEIQRNAKFLCMPLIFMKSTGAEDIPDTLFYQHITIFPEVILGGREYAAGSTIGVVLFPDGTPDIVMRGELFDDTSAREQIILIFMYDKFITGDLNASDKYYTGFRCTELNEKQRTVRKELIEYIQDSLLTKI